MMAGAFVSAGESEGYSPSDKEDNERAAASEPRERSGAKGSPRVSV